MRTLILVLLGAALLHAQTEGPLTLPEPETPVGPQPYDLKGDQLGMGLAEFKLKHRRVMRGDSKLAPMCSDSSPSGYGLLNEPGDVELGIINCKLSYPFEERSPGYGYEPDTIANVPAQSLVYTFVDGRLSTIYILFPQKDVEEVKGALVQKFGEPQTREIGEYQNSFGARFPGEVMTWSNGVSTLRMTERSGTIDNSTVMFAHDELVSRANERRRAACSKGVPDI